MTRPSAGTVAKAWLLERALSRVGAAGAPRRSRRSGRAAAVREPLAPPRGRLFAAMVAFLVVGMPAMLLFEAALTRLVGVLCIFGFIICGVFAIADPRFLADAPEDGR